MRFEPHVGFHTGCGAYLAFSLSLCPSPPLVLSHSLSQRKKERKERKEGRKKRKFQ